MFAFSCMYYEFYKSNLNKITDVFNAEGAQTLK